MFKPAIKRAVLAAALLVPTLVGVVAAAPAHASGGSASQYPASTGSMLGASSIILTHNETTGTCAPFTSTRFYSVAVSPNWDTYYGIGIAPDYHFAPGASVSVNLVWDTDLNTCAASEASTATLQLRDMSGNPMGSSTDVTINNCCSFSGSVTASSLHFDTTGFGAGGGTPLVGQYYMGVVLHGGNEDGASTEGGVPTVSGTGNSVASSYTKGLFSTGYMAGIGDSRGASGFSTDESSAGKKYSLVRLFGGNWDLPGDWGSGTAVDTNAAAGRGIIWSVNPQGSNFTLCGTDTRWKTVADGCMDGNGTTDKGLKRILAQLDSVSGHYHVPILFAIRHEPHATASDWASTCSPSPCEGSASEYVSMYAHLRSLLGNGDVNYPHVHLIYIAVDTNMNTSKDHVTGVSCGSPGCGDTLRPADSDYDLLGPDVYNYFKWKSGCVGGGTGCTSTSGAWLWPTSPGGGSNRVNTIAKLGDSTHGDLAVAVAHYKHIVIPELGTHPGCPGSGTSDVNGTVGHCATGDPSYTKDAWFRDLGGKLTSDSTYETWFEGFAYFNNSPTNPGVPSTYDWEYVNRTNSNNSESACPSGVPCWTGLQGYQDSFVNNTSYNSNRGNWFVGTSSTVATFQP